MSWGGEVWQACWGHRRRGWLAGNRLVSRRRAARSGRCTPRAYNPRHTPCAIAPDTRAVRVVLGRAQAARLLHRRHLLLAGRLALRRAVHLHVVVDRLRTGRLLGYRRSCCWAIGGVRAACGGCKGPFDGVRVRTGTAGSSLLLTLVWIVFIGVSSLSRSGSGLAVGIWCSGIILLEG